jgi:hypothetical protein
MSEKVISEIRFVETEDGFRVEFKGDKERLRQMGFGPGAWGWGRGRRHEHFRHFNYGQRHQHGCGPWAWWERFWEEPPDESADEPPKDA